MGLSYLNKKKMHPGKFSNIQEVWEREERQREQNKIEIERNKRLKQEKEEEELRKIKIEAGILPKNVNERLDFIYKESENHEKVDKDKQNNKKEKVIIPLIDNNIVNSKNEMYIKMREDPLFMMKKDEAERKRMKETKKENESYLKRIVKEMEKDILFEGNRKSNIQKERSIK
jgi:hypothetical protein